MRHARRHAVVSNHHPAARHCHTSLRCSSCVRWSPNSRFVLASSLDGRVRLWDYLLGKPAKTYEGHDNHSLCCAAGFASAVPALVSPRADSAAARASVPAAPALPLVSAPAHAVSSAASSSMDVDHTGPAAPSMDAATCEQLRRGCDASNTAERHTDEPTSMRGRHRTCVASGSEDGRLHLWDVNTRERVAAVRAHTGPVLALDCHPWLSSIVTAGGGNGDFSVKLWRPRADPVTSGVVT